MLVIPAIDILGGRCVQLVGGDPDRRIVDLPDPKEQAAHFQREGARMLHLVDLDAALGTGGNFRTVQEILSVACVPVQVGGGLRTLDLVDSAINAGARWVVVGTKAVQDPDWLREAVARYPMRVRVALDVRDGRVLTRGWKEASDLPLEAAVRAMDVPDLGGIICTNVSVEGQLRGIDLDPVHRLLRIARSPVFVSGGVTSLDDVRAARAAGAAGVIVGAALYTQKFHLHDAMEAVA